MSISKEVLKKYKGASKAFVETGTYQGGTVEAVLDMGFDEIHTIELAKHLYEAAAEKFKDNENVNCIFGDSIHKVPEVLEKLDTQAMFWLDGHFSYGDTAFGENSVPLIEELDAIKKHHIKTHTILIDDIRLIGKRDPGIPGWCDFTLRDLKKKCLEINKMYKFEMADGHIKNDILVAYID